MDLAQRLIGMNDNRVGWWIRVLIVICFTASTSSGGESITVSQTYEPVTVVLDSPEVRRLIAEQEMGQAEIDRFWREKHTNEEARHRIEDMSKHPDEYPRGRADFFRDMQKSVAITLPGNTHAEVMEVSTARCGRLPFETITYVRLKVTKGSSKGLQIWACRNTAHLPFEKP